jgi:thiamine biosynthesis protein ThiS
MAALSLEGPNSHYNEGCKLVSNPSPISHIDVRINGEARTAPAGLNIRSLLEHLGLGADRVAVELNRRLVRKAEWDSAAIEAGAEVEIVEFVGGG